MIASKIGVRHSRSTWVPTLMSEVYPVDGRYADSVGVLQLKPTEADAPWSKAGTQRSSPTNETELSLGPGSTAALAPCRCLAPRRTTV